MFNIRDIQGDIYRSLAEHTSIPIYFYPPQRAVETYIQINAVRVLETKDLGEGLAAVEVNIEVKSESRSSLHCLQIMDLICELYQQRKMKFSNFTINNVGDLDRMLMINQEQKWVGDITMNFWLELVN